MKCGWAASKCDFPKNSDPDHPGFAILSKEFLPVYSEKLVCYMLIEFSSMCQIVIKTVD